MTVEQKTIALTVIGLMRASFIGGYSYNDTRKPSDEIATKRFSEFMENNGAGLMKSLEKALNNETDESDWSIITEHSKHRINPYEVFPDPINGEWITRKEFWEIWQDEGKRLPEYDGKIFKP